MKTTRLLLSGAITWLLVFTTFALVELIPGFETSVSKQSVVVGVFMIPAAILGAYLYFRHDHQTNGLRIALIMSAIALTLDALITVPLIEIPRNGSYQQFFSRKELWILVFENTLIILLYWKVVVRTRRIKA